ncbi:acyl-CoA thioesterase [Parvibium lacunae]|uniref:Acyl-CoA thioesterase n=1 Tax=Parvibium lacunae TaxID=1888893 RepID=A0A368L287_9BURK|nr:thioesterase family protein [Parvibium lacunae]RCS57500.1 acyl-CoA thioesterase [Parvibium lacunae]
MKFATTPALVTSTTELMVPFNDLDPLQIVWHGNYLRYCEIARADLLRKIDYDYPQMRDSGYAWPIIECQLKYVAPARYAQKLRIQTDLIEYEYRLRLSYKLFDADSNQLLTRAETIQVAIDFQTQEMQFSSPAILINKVKSWMNETTHG